MIKLTGGYTPIPEGVHVFKIISAVYKEEFGKLEIKMQTKQGKIHTERFQLTRNGNPNEGAYKAFSFFARTAMNDFSLEEIDHEDLVGKYIKCGVEHEVVPSTTKPGETMTFVHLTDKFVATGYDEEDEAPKKVEAPKGGFNLEDLLG